MSALSLFRRRLHPRAFVRTPSCNESMSWYQYSLPLVIRAASNVIAGPQVDEEIRGFTEAFVVLCRRFTEAAVVATESGVNDLINSSRFSCTPVDHNSHSHRLLKTQLVRCRTYKVREPIQARHVLRVLA